MIRRIVGVALAVLSACSADDATPSARLDVTRDGHSAVLHATVDNLASPSFTWTLTDPQAGDLVTNGADATFIARDTLHRDAIVGVSVSVIGADANNQNVRLEAATMLEDIGGLHPTDDVYSAVEGQRLIVSAPGVLINDASDQDVSARLVTAPHYGQLVLLPDGSFTYDVTQAFYYTRQDTATYAVVTSSGHAEERTIKFSVAYLPQLGDDAFQVVADTALTASYAINDQDQDANDFVGTVSDPSWPDDNTVIATPPEHGTVALVANGKFTYTPAAAFTGVDSFTYVLTDSNGLSGTATVSLDVRSVDDAWVVQSGKQPCAELPCSLPLMIDAKGYTMTYRIFSYGGPNTGTFKAANADGSLSDARAVGNAPGEPMVVWITAGPIDFPAGNRFDFIVNDGTYDSPVMSISADIPE